MFGDPLRQFRWIGWAEAISFLLLLGIAMPLKYMAGMPLGVRVVGAAHGALFVLYVVAAVRAARHDRWSFKQLVIAWVASLLPFGPFLIDHRLRGESASSPELPPSVSTD